MNALQQAALLVLAISFILFALVRGLMAYVQKTRAIEKAEQLRLKRRSDWNQLSKGPQ